MLRRICLILLACAALAGCGADNPPNAGAAEVARRAHVPDGPAQITLFTVRDVRGDGGAHTSLLIDGRQSVLWDPAGSFRHPAVPEVDDVLYGISPLIRTVYTDYHVRPEYYVIRQTMPVSRDTADRLIGLAEGSGRAPRATCARATSRLLREAGLDVGRTWSPLRLMEDFGALPGVRSERIDMTNVDTNHNVVFGKNGVPLPPGG